jgi:hypothetical protein
MEAAVKAKYIHPYTNFGFRKLFGEETNKNLLIDFLNQLLPEKHKIVELSFKKTGQFPSYVIEPGEIIEYEESLKVFRDLKAVVKTAYEEGKKGAANG